MLKSYKRSSGGFEKMKELVVDNFAEGFAEAEKSVLISIRPMWCELIASGKKTIEVRKTRPKMGTPFKCYIYCTGVKSMNLQDYVAAHLATGGAVDDWSGKVIGEFVCDEILQFNHDDYNSPAYDISDDALNRTCLFQEDLYRYASGKTLYGWHISDLKIYDKPKELSEFGRGCDAEHINEIHCRDCKKLVSFDDCCEVMCKPLNRPPQSWCYVEELL